ncbi:App1 family protein [Rothia sp. P13129]|uniref:App1 family protein n=1 Tax=unclassified Rothia (in: high G+C Gram-positive bacteria) TaxID=2689056 RepID=UPI003ACB02CC
MDSLGTQDLRQMATEAADGAAHLGYRVAGYIHQWREKRARKAAKEPVFVPSVGYGTTRWIRVLGRALYKTDLFEKFFNAGHDDAPEQKIRGWRSFTAIAIAHAEVSVQIGSQIFLLRTDRGGVLDAQLEISLEPGLHRVTMSVLGGESAETTVYVVPPEQKIGVICDVDDTVMVTALPRPLLAAWNSFVLNEHARIPTPGMSVLLDRIHREHPYAPFMYLSTGAWNVTPTLQRFLSRNAYPKGTFLLTDWGPTPQHWFRSGTEHKVESLKRLAAEFPEMKWILIGDDGQRDPEIYNGFAVRYPQNVAAILIRNLTIGESVLASGRVWGDSRAQEITKGKSWSEANDGASLIRELQNRGILKD